MLEVSGIEAVSFLSKKNIKISENLLANTRKRETNTSRSSCRVNVVSEKMCFVSDD